MIGYVTDAVANALKTWPALNRANIIPLRSADGDSVVIDTPLPSIIVRVVADDSEGNTFIGGGIRHYIQLELHCLLPVINYTFSHDGGAQAQMLDLSDEAIRCMERTDALDYIKSHNDFSVQFDKMETSTTYGTSGANTVVVDVHKVVYKGSVDFDLYNDKEVRPITGVALESVTIKTVEE